jgi:tyrosyl-tRNA synthetase
MLARDLFERRLQAGNPIHLHEFFYPLMQAYDSVAMDVDGEIGGNDQTFNMLAGRDLMMKMKQKEKFVLTTKLLADPTGKKMGKTEGNMITLNDSPQNMFGKIMSWPDEMIVLGFELCTTLSLDEIETVQMRLKQGENPRNLKAELAKNIVTLYYDRRAADQAEQEFNKIFQAKGLPEDMPLIKVKAGTYPLVDLIMLAKLAPSKSEAKRLIQQGGVSLNQTKITDWQTQIKPKNNSVLKIGKRKFAKLQVK